MEDEIKKIRELLVSIKGLLIAVVVILIVYFFFDLIAYIHTPPAFR